MQLLRGISQIFFINNPLSGVLIVAALAVANPKLALLVVLGSAAQTTGAEILKFHDDNRCGMMGYNGALVGAAAALFAGYGWLAVALTIIGALACIVVHEGLRRLFATTGLKKFGLPVSTAPFCIVATVIFGALGRVVESVPPSSASGPSGLALGLSNSFSEVVLADGWLCGLIILVALFVGSWRIGVWGIIGAAIALGIKATLYAMPEVSTGLYSYCAVLVAIAFGAVLWPEKALLTRSIAVVVGVVLTLPLQAALAYTPIPVFTWPFIIAMWIVVMVARLGNA